MKIIATLLKAEIQSSWNGDFKASYRVISDDAEATTIVANGKTKEAIKEDLIRQYMTQRLTLVKQRQMNTILHSIEAEKEINLTADIAHEQL